MGDLPRFLRKRSSTTFVLLRQAEPRASRPDCFNLAGSASPLLRIQPVVTAQSASCRLRIFRGSWAIKIAALFSGCRCGFPSRCRSCAFIP